MTVNQPEAAANAYDNLYRSLGEFVVRYEELVGMMQLVVKLILQQDGLKKMELADALLAKRGAAEVSDMFVSIIATARGPHAEIPGRIMANINSRLQSLQSRRNDLLHRHWLVATPNFDDPADFLTYSLKAKNTTSGVDANVLEMGRKEIAGPTKEAHDLHEVVIQLLVNIVGGRPLENGLVLNEKRIVERTKSHSESKSESHAH